MTSSFPALEAFRKIRLALERVGWANTLRFVLSSARKDWLERRYRKEAGQAEPLPPGELLSAAPIPGGARLRFRSAEVEIVFLAADLARLSWEPGEAPPPYAIAREDWPPVQVKLEPAEQGWQLSSAALSIYVRLDGALEFRAPGGRLLREERPPLRLGGAAPGAAALPGEIRWVHRARLQPEAATFGMGLRAFPANLRGRTCRNWNLDPPGGYQPGIDPLYLCIPLYLALHDAGSYLVFYENAHPSTFSFADPGAQQAGGDSAVEQVEESVEASFEGGMLRYYFIPGPPGRALERYSQLTGRPALPPRWALGYHQSRWGYQTEEDIQRVAQGFQQHELPLSAIHLDIDYMDGYRVFTVDRRRFAHLEELAESLGDRGVRLVAILDPGVKRDAGYYLYRQGRARRAFCTLANGKEYVALVWPGWSVFPDFTDPAVREWWGEQYARLLKVGISGFWHDMNEPTSFGAWGDMTPPRALRHSLDGRGGDHRQAHNLYALLMNRAGYQALAKRQDGRRPWLLTRSGWAGVARYAWVWTADTESSWPALRQSIASILGLSLSGIPFSGCDVGGFLGAPDAELYLRWFQASAFLPFFRTHSAIECPPREPWSFGEPYLGILRRFLRLRERLLPYLYTLAWEASQTGSPLVRPLFWTQPQARHLWSEDAAFTLGEALLVAPALEPGSQSVEARLPAGAWYDFWEGSLRRGPGPATLPASLERIPVLVRGGSLLPTLEGERLVLHLYPPEEGHGFGSLYSDCGDGSGPWRIDRFRFTLTPPGIELIRCGEGDFPLPDQPVDLQVHGFSARRAWVDGREVPLAGERLQVGWFDRLLLEGNASP